MWATFAQLGFEVYVKNNLRTTAFLNFLQKQTGTAIHIETKKRIRFYTTQSALTNLWFSTLRGYKPSPDEKNLALYLGAFTPLAYDLMDATGLKFDELHAFNQNHTDAGALFSFLFDHMIEACCANDTLDNYFKKAHCAQDESLRQLQTDNLGLAELTEITKNKGGYYTTLYRCILQNEMQPSEAEAIFQLGAILQLINDLFDTWKDKQNGVQTLVNHLQDVPALQALFSAWVDSFVSKYQEIPYPPKNKEQSLKYILCIVARGQVALIQFAALQKNHSHFNISGFDRKALIVDMESVKNIKQNIQSAKAFLKGHL